MDSPAHEIIASRLVIQGPNGRPRIELGLVDGDPVLRMFDAGGHERIRLGFGRDDFDDHGGPVAELRLTATDDGGEAVVTAAYGNHASIGISGEVSKVDRTAAGAWLEANEDRLEVALIGLRTISLA